MIKSTGRLIAKVVAPLGTASGLLQDFFIPIAPFGLWAGEGLLALFILSMALYAIPWSNNALQNKLSKDYWYMPTGIVIALLSGLMFVAYSKSNDEINNGHGWLASNIDAFTEIQQQLGVIKKDVHTTALATASIDQKMDNVKKETSSNPRKELANNGLPWTREGFMDVIRQDDFDMATLYARGGMKLEVEGVYGISFLSSLEEMSDKMASLLAKNNSFKSGKTCGWAKNYEVFYRQIKGDGVRKLISVTCRRKSEMNALKVIINDKENYLKNGVYASEKSKCYGSIGNHPKGLSPIVANSSDILSKRRCDEAYYKSVDQVNKETKETIHDIEQILKLMS